MTTYSGRSSGSSSGSSSGALTRPAATAVCDAAVARWSGRRCCYRSLVGAPGEAGRGGTTATAAGAAVCRYIIYYTYIHISIYIYILYYMIYRSIYYILLYIIYYIILHVYIHKYICFEFGLFYFRKCQE